MCDCGRNIKSALLANTVCPAALQKLVPCLRFHA